MSLTEMCSSAKFHPPFGLQNASHLSMLSMSLYLQSQPILKPSFQCSGSWESRLPDELTLSFPTFSATSFAVTSLGRHHLGLAVALPDLTAGCLAQEVGTPSQEFPRFRCAWNTTFVAAACHSNLSPDSRQAIPPYRVTSWMLPSFGLS